MFADGDALDAELVVIAAGIRPNADIARKAGLTVNKGIVVDDSMRTSDPNIYAVGECAEHNGTTYGLVAPLYEQGKVLAAAITGAKDARYEGAVPAAKLKIMGLDVFSAGDFETSSPDTEVVKYEDPSLGIYKKLTLRQNKLQGVILVGDPSDSHRYVEWLRNSTDIQMMRRSLLFPSRQQHRRTREPGLLACPMEIPSAAASV